jgi:hypothetical protein
LGNNEIDLARREEVKRMVQQEYNQYLTNQKQRKVGQIYENDGHSPARVESRQEQRPDPRSDSSLVMAGQQMSGLMRN